MAVDIFLKIGDGTNGIPGDSTDAKHKGEIVIAGYSWAENQAGLRGSGTSGAGAGKATLQDFRFSAPVSLASQGLFGACAQGAHYPTAVLTLRKSGQAPVDFLHVTFTDVIVSSYQMGVGLLDTGTYSALGSQSTVAANQNVPIDQFSLNFAKISYAYASQSSIGSVSPVTPTSVGG